MKTMKRGSISRWALPMGLSLSLVLAARPASAVDFVFLSNTCYTLGGLNACAGLGFHLQPYPDRAATLDGGWRNSYSLPSGMLLTAFGLYTRELGYHADHTYGPSGWVGSIPGTWVVGAGSRKLAHPRLSGYSIFAHSGIERQFFGEPTFQHGFFGQLFSGEVYEFDLLGNPLPAEMFSIWRAENEDGTIVLDCFQNPLGGTECLTSVPEPATTLLLLTGLVGIATVTMLSRKRLARNRG